MKTIDAAIKEANKTIINQIKLAVKRQEMSKIFWHNMKIVPIYKWLEYKKRQPGRELKSIPEQFSEYIRYVDDVSDDVMEQRIKWFREWVAYLVAKKDPSFGAKTCQKCISYPSGMTMFAGTEDKGTQRILIENLIEKKAQIPCEIKNCFECPYGEENLDMLFFLREAWKILDAAIWNTVDYSSNRYVIDCKTQQADWSKFYYNNYRKMRFSVDQLLEKLSGWLVIETQKDLYETLMDTKKLEKLIDQYIVYLENESKDLENEKIERVISLKEDMIREFSKLASKEITYEYVLDCHNRGLYPEGVTGPVLTPAKDVVRGPSKIRTESSCQSCLEWGNYYCVVCKIEVCKNHVLSHLESAGKSEADNN